MSKVEHSGGYSFIRREGTDLLDSKWETGTWSGPIRQQQTPELRLCQIGWALIHAVASGKTVDIQAKTGKRYPGVSVRACPADVPLPTSVADRRGLSNVRAILTDGTSLAVNDMHSCRLSR